MPSIFRNTRLTATAVWEAIGLALVVAVFERFLEVPMTTWTIQVFRDFGSVNIFAALSGNQSSILQSLPMLLAWALIGIICYTLYVFLDYVWDLIKAVVPLGVSSMIHKTDIFDNLVLLGATIRIGILLAVASLIPMAYIIFRPLSQAVTSAVSGVVADPVYRAVWVIVATFPIWLAYFLIIFYVIALISYEKNEVSLDEEHNPLLGEDGEE